MNSLWNIYQTLDAKNVIAHQDNDRAVMQAYGFPIKTMNEGAQKEPHSTVHIKIVRKVVVTSPLPFYRQ